ncbi:MAG: sigma-54-dependent Fis family transcriptional regulator [Deltaproteobacteria bacterium]|nr:MAG: sigma-54-dependent Fis family transcriptional regulator [Deltaproteobacteria bacterium]
MNNKTKPKSTILIVDDEPNILSSITEMIEAWGYSTMNAFSGSDALHMIDTHHIDLILSDQVMPGMDGLALLKEVKAKNNDLPFILLTGHGTIDKAVIAMRQGAADYLLKPCKKDEIQLSIERVLKFSQLDTENRELKKYISDLFGFEKIITKSPHMHHAIKLAAKVAGMQDAAVTICGESGTGKELLARAIHHNAGCIASRFVGVNCAAIPAPLLESELFGHIKGAFTGADYNRQGKFDLAQQGTILLDEIGDMPPDVQPKLLRVLEERCYESIGSNIIKDLNLRVIATTHHDLEKLVTYGKFRRDLFHRINRFPIFLPPLRDRKEDIPLLADHFLKKFRQELGKPLPGISKSGMNVLMEHQWPGNIRELKNLIERAAIITDGELIRSDHLTTDTRKTRRPDTDIQLDIRIPTDKFSMTAATEQIKDIILKRCNGNKSKAADMLKVNRNRFYR